MLSVSQDLKSANLKSPPGRHSGLPTYLYDFSHFRGLMLHRHQSDLGHGGNKDFHGKESGEKWRDLKLDC